MFGAIMRKFLLLFVLTVALIALPAPTQADSHARQASPSPLALLYQYYTAINMGDYATAYNLWINPPRSYEQFAGGFAVSTHIVPYFNPLTGTAAAGQVRSVLLAYRADGQVESYAGCFDLGLSGANWRITGSTFRLLTTGSPPSNAAISTLLAQGCSENSLSATTVYDPADQMMVNYFDLINRENYAFAYSLWLSPLPGAQPNGGPPQDYRRPFDRFVAGYNDTAYVYVYPGDYLFMGAAAGKPYLQGVLPLVLVSQQTDGTFRTYNGCYVIGTLPSGGLGVVNGRFYLTSSAEPNASDILSRVNIDCVALNIPN